jgi:hypothetical protein
VCGFGLGAVFVAVFAVRGCVGDRGFGVEVGFLDVNARGVGRGKVKTVEDAGLDAEGIGVGGCCRREGGRCISKAAVG